MRRYALVVACLSLFALTMACTHQASDTRAADIKAVKAVETAWVKDIATKDVDKFASYYSEDASFLFPNQPIVNGRDNIKAEFRPMLADPNFGLTFQSTRAEASKGGDFVYTVGTYELTLSDPKSKKRIADNGKYLTVFRKQADGKWEAVADAISSDNPAPVSAKSSKPTPRRHRTTRHKRRAGK
jgi:uncharacterized protein (TIGR02246 family)